MAYTKRKDIDSLYEIYFKQSKRIVSRNYQSSLRQNPSYEVMNKKQFENYVNEELSGLYGSALTKAIKSIIKQDYMYTQRQNECVLEHCNEQIRITWLQAAGRNSSQGRYRDDWVLKPEKCDANRQQLASEIISNKGLTAKLKDCLLTMEEVMYQSLYFQHVYDTVMQDIFNDDGSQMYS